MNRLKPRNFSLLAATFAALLIPALFLAQKRAPKLPPGETMVPVAVPTWQKGPNWTFFHHQLVVDFGNLAYFHAADLKLGPPAPGQDRVVFMGDSITHAWNLAKYFPGKPYINRGISAQTSTQMLVRYRQDVIDLKPKVVVILAGTNDIAQNTGPMTLRQSEGNLADMAQLARANGIRAVLCSVLPSVHFWWHRQLKDPAPRIAKLNQWIRHYAASHGYVYVDYYSKMKDAAGGLPKNLSHDGVHPSPAGFAVMAPLAQAGIDKALKEKGW